MISARIIVLLALVSCCWSAGANVITTSPPPIAVEAVTAVANEPTLAPAVSHPVATAHGTVAPEPNTAAGPLSTHAPAAIVSTHSSPSKHPLPATTLLPHLGASTENSAVATTIHSTVSPATVAPVTANVSSGEACDGFCDYIKPICESLGKISAKQMFKIQTQFKQFVLKTNGKLSLCFVEHYGLDPTFKAVSHEDLNAICASRKHSGAGKGSFMAFRTCAGSHWDPEVDKELASIKAARATSISHQHPKSETAAANIEHDEDELSMISEVVNKVLGHGTNLNGSNADVKVIDVSGKTTVAPALISDGNSTQTPIVHKLPTTISPPPKGILKDPNNTVMVFVDDAKTTLAPSHAPHVNLTVHTSAITTVKPAAVNVTTSAPVVGVEKTILTTNSTTITPVLSRGNPSTTKAPITTNLDAITTSKPVIKANGTTTLAPATLKPGEVNGTTLAPSGTTKLPVTTPASNPASSTSLAPKKTVTTASAAASTSTSAPTTAKPTTAKPTTMKSTTIKPTLKPIETIEQILHRQELEKQALDNKLKAERTKAINQLKKQDASSHTKAADAKIHQIEHERQMSIDPIGHTIKHQQYEANKQKGRK